MRHYNHTDKAGNKADIWKHSILLQVANKIKPKTYFESHCGAPFHDKGKLLLSSYMKVKMFHDCTATVCDTDLAVSANIPIGMRINFLNVDGWEQMHAVPRHDLYFVDPSYITAMDLVLLRYLLEDNDLTIPLMAWYPLLDGVHLGNYDFGVLKIETRFNEGSLIGCGMAFKNIPEEIVRGLHE